MDQGLELETLWKSEYFDAIQFMLIDGDEGDLLMRIKLIGHDQDENKISKHFKKTKELRTIAIKYKGIRVKKNIKDVGHDLFLTVRDNFNKFEYMWEEWNNFEGIMIEQPSGRFIHAYQCPSINKQAQNWVI